jgi:ElaB/YqjD/DUF883 family membrane-anchored ribosome-binding protein
MKEHRTEVTAEPLTETARRVAEVGQEAATRTTKYIRDGLGHATDYAQDLSSKASEQIADLTGRAPEAWTRELRSFVEQHPLKSLLITIGVGYLLGKVVRRA